MAHYEPPHQELHCLQIQLLSSLVHVIKELKDNVSDQCANTQSSYGTSSLLFPVFIWTNRSGYDHSVQNFAQSVQIMVSMHFLEKDGFS